MLADRGSWRHNRRMIRLLPTFALIPLLASCVGPSAPVAPPRPVAAPAPVPVPAPSSPVTPPTVDRYSGDWSVADVAPGEWHYASSQRGSMARFVSGSGPVQASISCTNGQITLARAGVIPADMAVMLNIRNSFAERSLPIRIDTAHRMLTATLPAADPLWDQLIYSRGRFLIEATRQAPIIVPTQPELA